MMDFRVRFEPEECRMDVELGIVTVAGEAVPYSGAYDVTPRAGEDVILPTKDRQMRADVTVRKVPYFEVANDKGDTVYIAAEV